VGPPLSLHTDVNPLRRVIGADGGTCADVPQDLNSVVRLNGHALDVRGTGNPWRIDTDCKLFSFLVKTLDADGGPRTTLSLPQPDFGKARRPAR
jgi:hypothetical protein